MSGIQNPRTWLLVASVSLAVALGQMIPARFGNGLPQVPGENVLALVLGDARQVLSGALMEKAEEYFHGGLRNVECGRGLGGAEEAHEHGAHSHEGSAPPQRAARPFDVWDWVNRQVHEQVDRHLAHDQAIELLPWIWAACRASPQNLEAFQVGAYVLSSMLGKPEEGVRLLEESIKKNPACAELDFSLGELLFNSLHDAKRAEPWFLSARAKCRPADDPAGKEARVLKVRALFYLGYLAKQRGEMDRVRAYAKEAEELYPEHVSTRDLRKMLKE